MSPCLNFNFDAEDLFCWRKQRKQFSWATAAQAVGNQMGLLILDLIFMIRDMCINFILDPLTKFTTTTSSSSRGITFTDILSWNISLMTTKIVSINRRIITICTIKKEHSFWIWGKANKNWAKKLDHNSLNKRKPEELSIKNWAQTCGHWSIDGKEIKNRTK